LLHDLFILGLKSWGGQAGRQREDSCRLLFPSHFEQELVPTQDELPGFLFFGWGRRIWGWVARVRGGYLVHNNLEKTLVDRNFEFFSGLGNLDKMLLKLQRRGVWRGSRAVCAGADFP
jgi:hypothetical protein